MGLAGDDKKALELLVKAAIHDASTPVGLARKMVPSQGSVDDFAYGLISGMIIGNFISSFEKKNGRPLDKDEIADLFSIMMVRMPRIRIAIRKELGD